MIRFDGYYISEGEPWIDWHAGHKFEGCYYKVLCFFKENKVLATNLEFNDLLKVPETIKNLEATDSFSFQEKNVEIIIRPNFMPVKQNYVIVSPNLLLDKDLKEYRFIKLKKELC